MKPSSRISILKAAASAAVLLLSSGFAGAHGIWIAERHSDLAVVYGHGSSDEGYDPAKLTSLRLLDERGAELPVQRMDGDDHVAFAKVDGAAVAVSTLDNGFWSKGANGKWVNKSKEEVEGATEGGRYLKYSVTILGHLKAAPKPQDLDFQKALQHATEGRGGQDFALTRTHQSHFDVRIQMEGDLGYRIPNQPSVDGNTVDTHTEQMAFTRNAVEYQASLEFLSGKFRGLKNAIRGE